MDDCILWTKAISKNGYGASWYQGKQIGAHRLAWILANGPIPKGMLVCHKCDVRHCVNAKHLFIGTILDNNRDKIRKGRGNPRWSGKAWKIINGQRECALCKTTKPISEYSPNYRSKHTGNMILHARCKECIRRKS